MEHLLQLRPGLESMLLSFIQPLQRQDLEERLKSRKISQQEYTKQAFELAGDSIIKRLQISTPGFAAPSFDDKNFSLLEFGKVVSKAIIADQTHQVNLREEVQRKAPGLVAKIFDDWEALQTIVGVYSDVLSRRWSKRIVKKRKALLLEAWPAMPPGHRPDFDVLRRRLKGPKYRDMIMMPHLNLEDLSMPRYLIRLLESRTKLPPEHFAWSDSFPFQAAVIMEAVRDDPGFTEIMLLTGQKTQESYGTLQILEDQEEAEDMIWTEYGFQLNRGLTVLETQAKLYSFLLSITKLLLHDIELSNSTEGTATSHTYPNKEQAPEPREWLSITEINTQAFYDSPQRFSLTSLRRLVNAKRDEAEDFFSTLHEDPSFFQTRLLFLQSQHMETQRKILEEGNFNRVWKAENGALRNAWMQVVLKTCRDISIWTSIETEISRLEMLSASYHIEHRPLSKRLPAEYETAMGRFVCLTTFLWRLAVKDLGYILVSSPKLAEYFEFDHSAE